MKAPELPSDSKSWDSVARSYLSCDRSYPFWKRLCGHRLIYGRGYMELSVSAPDRTARRAIDQIVAGLSTCGCHVLGRASTRCQRIANILFVRGDATNHEIRAAVLEGLAASLKLKGRPRKGKGE